MEYLTDFLRITMRTVSLTTKFDSIFNYSSVHNLPLKYKKIIYKPVDIIFEVDTILDDEQIIARARYYPSLRYADIVKIKFENNVLLDDMLFNTKGMTNAMKQSEKICLSIYELEESEIKDARNI